MAVLEIDGSISIVPTDEHTRRVHRHVRYSDRLRPLYPLRVLCVPSVFSVSLLFYKCPSRSA
jgi:hypothetical protein